MDLKTKKRLLDIASLICGIWFLATSWLWVWLFNVFFSFPVGLIGILLWYFGKKYDGSDRLSKVSIVLLALGWASSVISFLLFYIFSK
ncbi:MAG: hypothetical protein ABJH04_03065 [Cyclobacteriaceae bacterium]